MKKLFLVLYGMILFNLSAEPDQKYFVCHFISDIAAKVTSKCEFLEARKNGKPLTTKLKPFTINPKESHKLSLFEMGYIALKEAIITPNGKEPFTVTFDLATQLNGNTIYIDCAKRKLIISTDV